MPAMKRAVLYLRRKKGKTVLLLMIFFVMAALLLVGMAIGGASELASAQLRQSIGGYFKIQGRGVSVGNENTNDPLIEQVMGAGGVKSHNAMDTLYLTVERLTLKPARFTAEGDGKARLARILGNTDSSLHEYFILNILTLDEGRHIAPGDTNAAMVSRELAESNGLAVGDSISVGITADVTGNTALHGEAFAFEIVGIFNEASATEPGEMTPECDLPANFIFVDRSAGKTIKSLIHSNLAGWYNGGVSFFADDPKELDQIAAEVMQNPNIDWDSLELEKNNTAYARAIVPLTRLGAAARSMLFLIAGISVLLLSLLLLMWTRDRIHEIGVLLSVGIRKSGIFLQQILECVILFAAALALACAVSLPVSHKIGNMLYESVAQAEPPRQAAAYPAYTGEPVDMESVTAQTDFAVRPSAGLIAAAGGAGLLLIFASVGLSFILIIRKKPKDLLTMME